jgi:hypothetical protein
LTVVANGKPPWDAVPPIWLVKRAGVAQGGIQRVVGLAQLAAKSHSADLGAGVEVGRVEGRVELRDLAQLFLPERSAESRALGECQSPL